MMPGDPFADTIHYNRPRCYPQLSLKDIRQFAHSASYVLIGLVNAGLLTKILTRKSISALL